MAGENDKQKADDHRWLHCLGRRMDSTQTISQPVPQHEPMMVVGEVSGWEVNGLHARCQAMTGRLSLTASRLGIRLPPKVSQSGKNQRHEN